MNNNNALDRNFQDFLIHICTGKYVYSFKYVESIRNMLEFFFIDVEGLQPSTERFAIFINRENPLVRKNWIELVNYEYIDYKIIEDFMKEYKNSFAENEVKEILKISLNTECLEEMEEIEIFFWKYVGYTLKRLYKFLKYKKNINFERYGK